MTPSIFLKLTIYDFLTFLNKASLNIGTIILQKTLIIKKLYNLGPNQVNKY